jgi:hypothetical protein
MKWLRSAGLQNVRDINELLRSATPWQSWYRNSHS